MELFNQVFEEEYENLNQDEVNSRNTTSHSSVTIECLCDRSV